MAADERTWRIGEVATATGLTVRALHHYDQIGLVVPSARTSGGHRLYTSADLMLLYQVTAMRQLGLSLEQVGILLAGRTDVRRVIARPGLPAASGRRVGPARLPAT
jgi:DNA-binding transcriptional MerR regulator